MSRSNYDKPFYVDVGTSVAAIRCASNHDIVDSLDHNGSKYAIMIVEKTCELMNREVEISTEKQNREIAQMREALERILSLTNSLDENCAVDPVEIRDIARDALVKGE